MVHLFVTYMAVVVSLDLICASGKAYPGCVRIVLKRDKYPFWSCSARKSPLPASQELNQVPLDHFDIPSIDAMFPSFHQSSLGERNTPRGLSLDKH